MAKYFHLILILFLLTGVNRASFASERKTSPGSFEENCLEAVKNLYLQGKFDSAFVLCADCQDNISSKRRDWYNLKLYQAFLFKYYNLSEDAQANLLEVASWSRSNKEYALLISALNTLGEIYVDLGLQVDAIPYFGEAEQLAKKHNQTEGLAETLVNIGNRYTHKWEFDHAIYYYEKARENSSSELRAADIEFNIACVSIYKARFDSLLSDHEKDSILNA